MRQLRWDVPFADLDPLSIDIIDARQDRGEWSVHVALHGEKTGWTVRFWDVVGVRFSNESFFDWDSWRAAFEAPRFNAAYIIDGGAMWDDFWPPKDGSVIPATHFVIATEGQLFEALAVNWDISDKSG